MNSRQNKLLLISLVTIFVIVLIAGVAIGSSNISFIETTKILFAKTFNLSLAEFSEKNVAIISSLRLPRVLAAALVGAALALSGLVLQSLLNNPIASPYTLGVSTGASIGVAIVIITGISLPLIGSFTLPFMGFIFAFLVVMGILLVTSRYDKNFSNTTIILVGIVTSLTLNGVLTLLILFAKDNARNIIYWQMGSLSLTTFNELLTYLPFFVIGTILLSIKYLELDALTLGETEALLTGVEVKKVKYQIIILATLLTGGSIAITGTIGFIGLIAPHVARKIFGNKHAYLIPSSMLIGAILLIISDTLARTLLSPTELPVGAITALIGGPFFAYVYFKKR